MPRSRYRSNLRERERERAAATTAPPPPPIETEHKRSSSNITGREKQRHNNSPFWLKTDMERESCDELWLKNCDGERERKRDVNFDRDEEIWLGFFMYCSYSFNRLPYFFLLLFIFSLLFFKLKPQPLDSNKLNPTV